MYNTNTNTNNYDYEIFYNVLLELREEFHRIGRIDDSNAKLDEVIKLIVIGFFNAKQGNNLDLDYVNKISYEKFGSKNKTAKTLKYIFKDIIKNEIFFNDDGTNIFGSNPDLNIQDTEDEIARTMIVEISKINFTNLLKNKESQFDIINEAFGHFVRMNFRNNKEDGQYMTPQEIVDPILDMIFNDISADANLVKNILDPNYDFKIMDPTCGVGTLLMQSLKYLLNFIDTLNIDKNTKYKLKEKMITDSLIGQDKVDRMVRLSKINFLLSGANISNIHHGNSISENTRIDEYNNKVDLIFTNPPFGAKHDVKDFIGNKSYPIINSLFNINVNSKIDSELILLDKCISLLKPNGRLAIIVPDSLISAKGINEKFRIELNKLCNIKAIIDLPSVTFAQAGTRTKTSLLYLERKNINSDKIFMAVCNEIGYDVKTKLGVPVKIKQGNNDMLLISRSYIDGKDVTFDGDFNIVNDSPSSVFIKDNLIIDNVYNPNFYNSQRLKIIKNIKNNSNNNINVVKLDELVDFVTVDRKSYYTTESIKHISVLHINLDGTINFSEVENFKPTSKGNKCYPGDILFSKINPRIPRYAVIPNNNYELVCSNEIEILRAKNDVNPYLIFKLFSLDFVQIQIESLTSGTSSSHNRIKTEQLKEIFIPYPKVNTKEHDEYLKIGRIVEENINLKYQADKVLEEVNTQICETIV